jgi:hypothetical protein
MSITINPTPAAANTEAHKAAKLASLYNRAQRAALNAVQTYDRANRSGVNLVNADPDFTAEEGWAAINAGYEAAVAAGRPAVPPAVLLGGSALSSAHVTAMAALVGDTSYVPPELPAGLTLTPNQDGTVTAVQA